MQHKHTTDKYYWDATIFGCITHRLDVSVHSILRKWPNHTIYGVDIQIGFCEVFTKIMANFQMEDNIKTNSMFVNIFRELFWNTVESWEFGIFLHFHEIYLVYIYINRLASFMIFKPRIDRYNLEQLRA